MKNHDDTGELLTIWVTGLFVGALLAMAVLSAGCSHRSKQITQEATRTSWQARETTTATSTATTAKVAASRKFTIRRQIRRGADGSSTETTTTTTQEDGLTVSHSESARADVQSAAGGEAQSQSKQTKQSETRTSWWWSLWGWLVLAAVLFVGAWGVWGPGLVRRTWARVLGVFRRR